MQNELVKEKIMLNRHIGNESTQSLLEGDIIVPDVMPDMAFLLKTDATLTIDKTEAQTDRVNYVGRLCVSVLYLAKGSEKPVHSMSITTTVDDFINIEGVSKDCLLDLSGDIENIDFRMLNDRKIAYRAVLQIKCSVSEKAEHEVVTDIGGLSGNQKKKSKLNISMVADNKDDRFIVKDERELPGGKPGIHSILQATAVIANKDIKVQNARVAVSGEIVMSVLYKTDDSGPMLEFAEYELPFSGSIDAPFAREGMYGDISLKVADCHVSPKKNADGEERMIEAEVIVSARASVNHQQELEILEDAYCINKDLQLERETVKYPKTICQNRNQFTVKEVVSLEEGTPDILQIFRVTGKAHVDGIEVKDDKVVAEGAIAADVLYIAKNDNAPLFCHKAVIPFRQVIETRGSNAKMEVTVSGTVDHIGFNMLSDREMELRFLVGFNTKVSDTMEAVLVRDVIFSDLSQEFMDGLASITIYVVQPGDSLWKIAKKYNTTIESLLALNEFEDPNKIYPGQKILVVK